MSINCIITGATDGIGKQTAIELSRLGYCLGLVGRNKEKGSAVLKEIKTITGNQSIKYFNTDLSVIKNISNLTEKIKNEYNSIDILINNAGSYFSHYEKTKENLEKTFALNHLSYFTLTNLLIDNLGLGQSGRVINIASAAHFNGVLDMNNIQMENRYKGWSAYCNSKLMNVLFTYEAHNKYRDRNISFNCLHPGFVNTNFGDANKGLRKNILSIGKKLIGLDVKKGAKTIIFLASSKEVKNISGKYFNKSIIVQSSKKSHSNSNQKKLWEYSQRLMQDLL
jgi:retinol dehydrogenase 12